MKHRVRMAMAVLLSVSACGKHDSAKPDDKSASSAVKPSSAPVTVAEVTANDYEPRASAMLDKTLAAYGAAGDCSAAAAAAGNPCDCNKAAAAVATFTSDNKSEIHALTLFGSSHPDLKQGFEAKHQDKVDARRKSEDSLLVESCKDNKAMQDVLKAME